MTDDIFVYEVDLPHSVKEVVTPCNFGYTVYINNKLSPCQKRKAYRHAVHHIRSGDFEKADVQRIERIAHQ